MTNQPTQNALHVQGVILFVAINLIWGTTFPLIEDVVRSLSPAALIVTRFVVAAVVFAVHLRRLNAILLRDGAVLGLLLFVYLATEAIALETTHANRASFIVSMSAIVVPLLGFLFGQRVLLRTFVAAGLAFTGIGVMSWESGVLGVGDLLMFGDAFIYAVYTLILGKVALRHPPLSLTAVQLLVIAVLGALWTAPEVVGQLEAIGKNWSAILYLALVGTAAVTWLQTVAQRWVSAQEAALLYTLEPVFSAVFSFWLLGEKLGVRGVIGASLVLAAMVVSQIRGSDGEEQVSESIVAALVASDSQPVDVGVVTSDSKPVGVSVVVSNH